MLGVITTRDAQRMAEQQGLDLVEVSPNADPPVCKIMDFGKFRYDESVRRKQARKSQTRQQIKEVKFHANVEEHDLQTKLRHIRDFLAEGHKIKLTLQYRGRENAHKDLGFVLMNRVIKELDPVATCEQQPRLMGKLLGCMLAARPQKPGSSPRPPSPPKPPSEKVPAVTVPTVTPAPAAAPAPAAPEIPPPAAVPAIVPADSALAADADTASKSADKPV